MDFTFTPEEERLPQEATQFVQQEWDKPPDEENRNFNRWDSR